MTIQAGGHAQVIAFFEDFLRQVRENPKIGYGVFVGVEEFTNDSIGGFTGDRLLDLKAENAVRCVAEHIGEMRVNRQMPPRPPNAPANLVVYNMPAGSICYDFMNWIIDAEMHRRMEGAPPPLKVHFWFGRNGKDGIYLPESQVMFDNVVKPALELVGAIEHTDAANGRYYVTRHIRKIVEQANEGTEIPQFKAPERSLSAMKKWLGAGSAPITSTLREAKSWPHRNSDLAAWIRFANDLVAQGERVIFVRDTEKANEQIDGFRICPDASINLHTRMALYDLAKANLFVANGPCELAKYSGKPYLIFTPIEPEDSPYRANTASFWKREALMEAGSQFPWAAPNQRIIWKKDTYENICAAWEELNVTIPAPHELSKPSNPNGKFIE